MLWYIFLIVFVHIVGSSDSGNQDYENLILNYERDIKNFKKILDELFCNKTRIYERKKTESYCLNKAINEYNNLYKGFDQRREVLKSIIDRKLCEIDIHRTNISDIDENIEDIQNQIKELEEKIDTIYSNWI